MLRSLSLLALAGFGALLSTPAMAQEMPEHGVFIMNSLLFLFGGVLVMFMACGFCMLEAGLVRAKNWLVVQCGQQIHEFQRFNEITRIDRAHLTCIA